MGRLVVIVHTEYHMLSCLSILAENHLKYSNIIVLICIPKDSNRFNFNFPKSIENITFQRVNIASFSSDNSPNLSLLEKVIFLEKEIVSEVLFFNRLPYFAQYLIRKCYKKGITASLGPDGAAAYTLAKKSSPRWSLKQFLQYNKFIINNGKKDFALHMPSLDYADQKHFKNIYAQFPSLIKNKHQAEVKKYGLLATSTSVKWSNLFFDFSIEKYLINTNNVFLFCNQPLPTLDAWNHKVFEYVIKNMPNYKIVVKAHPSTSIEQKKYFLSHPNIVFIEDTTPIELFCANLKNSLIASFWSTAGLYESDSNTSVWMYPYLEKNKSMYDYSYFPHRIKHIEYVDDLNQLKLLAK